MTPRPTTRTVPAPAPFAVAEATRTLFCETCGTWTKHSRAIVKHQSLYVCGCGTEILHFVVVKPLEAK